MMFHQFSRLLITLVMATTQIADWKKPRIQASSLRPRSTKSTRNVSKDMSKTRSPKITRVNKYGGMDSQFSIAASYRS